MGKIDRALRRQGCAVLAAGLALAAAAPAAAQGVELAKPSASVSAFDGNLDSFAVGLSGDWWLGDAKGAFASGVEGQDFDDPAIWTRFRTDSAEAGLRWAGDQPQIDLGFSWRAPIGLLPQRDFVSLSPTVDWTPQGEALALRSEFGLGALPRTALSWEQDRNGEARAAVGLTARIARRFGLKLEAAADEDGGGSEVRLRLVR